MRIFVGLGNPGLKYERNRHNVGFMAVDEVHRHNSGFGPWRAQAGSLTSSGFLDGEKTLLVKPGTFMNESGQAVGEILRYFKIPAEKSLIFHDDIDLDPGVFRIKKSGGHGGHNGLRSISAHIGEDYHRLRLGVGHPGRKELVVGHVLSDFAKSDQVWLEPLLAAIGSMAAILAKGEYSEFSNQVCRMLSSDSKSDQIEKEGEHSKKIKADASPPSNENKIAKRVLNFFR